jgi:hypothetical protein
MLTLAITVGPYEKNGSRPRLRSDVVSDGFLVLGAVRECMDTAKRYTCVSYIDLCRCLE